MALRRKSGKYLTAIIYIFSLSVRIYSLDLTQTQSSLGDMFFSYADKNEGRTSFRSLNIPSGGRAESLAGAFTGLSDDISFFDYNPAASCIMEQTQAAVFHNAWIADSAMETISATTRNDSLGLGAQLKCFYVPFTEYNLYGDRVAASYYSETSLTLNASYNFMAGYYFKGIAAGSNLRFSWRSVPDYTDNQTDAVITGSGLDQSAFAVMTDMGMILQFNAAKFYSSQSPNLKVGLTAANIGTAFTGLDSAIKTDDPLPSKLSGGISYRPFSFILLTGDIRQYINIADITEVYSCVYAAGCEIYLTDTISAGTGFALQGGNPRISLGTEYDIHNIKIDVNYTFDLTSSLNPVNHISLCAKFNLGDKGRALRYQQAQEHYLRGLEYYSSGTEENYIKAIEEWNISLSLVRNFDPARQAIQAASEIVTALHDIKSYGVIN